MEPRIETEAGTLEGAREQDVFVFRGIPYARPPRGLLRWRAPEPPEPWAGIRPAQAFGPAAPQNPSLLLQLQGVTDPPQSEDCLTLHVWTPALGSGSRPVLVWIHGGGFRSGAALEPIYDGARLAAREDVVVVTIQYRLGALGFLALPDLGEDPESPANFGLLDQIAALRWVRDHADRLGGDPRRVLVFGQSAGAMSVGALLGSPRARPLFGGALLESGAAENVSPLEVAHRVGEMLQKELDLSGAPPDRLRRVPVPALLAAQQRTIERCAREVSLPFQPCVDGAVIPRPPLEAVADGEARGHPLLVGTNADEWNLFGWTDPRVRALDEPRLRRWVARLLPEGERTDPELVAQVLARYRDELSGDLRPADLWCAIQSDRHFHLPAVRLVELQARVEPRTYRYLFTWRTPAFGGSLGSCHGLEVPFVFGTLEEPALGRFAGDGPEARRLGRRIQEAWAAFARADDPGTPSLAAWAPYALERRSTLRLDRTCELLEAPLEDRLRLWSELG